jgi:membrane-associated phospholipid phosphatase
VIVAIVIILATGWARVVTGHHSLLQVSLGVIVSFASVTLAFALMTVL